jgi:hypothetical protein
MARPQGETGSCALLFFGKKTQKMQRIFNFSLRNATLFKETA